MVPNELLYVIMSRLDQIQSDVRALRQIKSPDSPVLNFEETLQFLKIKRGTLREWVRFGRIPVHRLGRRVYFKRNVLEAILEKSRETKKRHIGDCP